MPAIPAISFLIVTHNKKELLRECIASIVEQSVKNWELIIVDNASTDGTHDIELIKDKRVKLIILDKNAGFAEPNNIALAHSESEIIATVNNDVVLSNNWAESVISAMNRNPKAGSVATLILQKKNTDLIDSAGFYLLSAGCSRAWQGTRASSLPHIHHKPFGAVATAAAYRKTAIVDSGFFRQEFFAYYEDTDLAVRLALNGWETCYCHEAVSGHYGSATGGRGSNLQRYYLRRNIEYLFWINMQGFSTLKLLPAHIAYEAACLAVMLINRQPITFLKAKLDFFRNIKWVYGERKRLAEQILRTNCDAVKLYIKTRPLAVQLIKGNP